MVLGKGLNTVVERDKGSLVDSARSQLRRLAVEGRSDCTAVEQVGNSLRFIILVQRLVAVVFVLLFLGLSFSSLTCKPSC